jgi:predicted AAA+ superfamily ATPase
MGSVAISNRDRVGKAFELLAAGLAPFLDAQMKATAGQARDWVGAIATAMGGAGAKGALSDPQFQLKVMWEYWNAVFTRVLGQSERTLVSELRQARNRWAHNEAFNGDDCYRTLDSIQRLLNAVSAAEQASEVQRSKSELLRQAFEAEARKATPKADVIATAPAGGLRSWRDVITPHPDVASGQFQQAEFAADLGMVHRGQGAAEYVDAREFFRRTYLTEGLRQLLAQGAQRISGAGGAPVVDLQTNFGGGKTHSLLALYHLFSGLKPSAFPQDVQELLTEAGIEQIPPSRRAVLVGTALQPGKPSIKGDGTEVRTLWGELAWQLGGAAGFALVADADRLATNPGDSLRELFEACAPCLILIDEWVAYARQLYAREDLPAGNFDTHFSFAQALTEAARAVPGVLLVVSIPASDPGTGDPTEGSGVEVGGVGGREALKRLRNVIGRMESSWRAATAEESFEIVRRRLFEPVADPARFADRDATARTFGDMYRAQSNEFPLECREASYVARIKAAYPIHPELFARLYEDWSTLDRFQRTRGVLRLMASVIHALWARNDQAPLILPASIPLDDSATLSELTRYLDDNWKPIVDADVDGPTSTPAQLDLELPAFGRHLAARRVARTVFLGSAPTARNANRGLEDQRIRLGCVLPGESLAIFGDALRRLTDRSTYLYVDGARYWFGVQPSVTRMAQERAERLLGSERVHEEIIKRLRSVTDRGDFPAVHVAPTSTSEVPDEADSRLVIIPPTACHTAKSTSSAALAAAKEIVERRGSAPRLFRNMLLFLAPDQRRMEELEQATRELLAWREIDEQAAVLNLDPHQASQARTKHSQANDAVALRIAETYQWLLVPEQAEGTVEVAWQELRADGQGSLAMRASRRLVNDGHLMKAFAPVLLRLQLDGVLRSVWEDGHVAVANVWDLFARYLYLPRLRDIDVLLGTVKLGPASVTWQAEGFATADVFDEKAGRYLGLVAGEHPPVVAVTTLLVQPALALAQLEAEPPTSAPPPQGPSGPLPSHPVPAGPEPEPVVPQTRRFYGVVTLDPERLNRDFGRVAQEVVQHLTSLVGTDVEVTVEVRAASNSGFPEQVVRTVNENARTLKFTSHEFEKE